MTLTRPSRCYIIAHTPRCGSNLLCEALASTGVAGTPTEYFWDFDGTKLTERYGTSTKTEALQKIYEAGCTPNGVFGVKMSIGGEWFDGVINFLREALSLQETTATNEVLEAAFPNLRIIFMLRRDKLRQAISHWKAIQSNVWHVWKSRPAPVPTSAPEYAFAPIDHLLWELSTRDAEAQNFLNVYSGPRPLTVVYEDFIRDYEATIATCLSYLDLDAAARPKPPDLVRQADSTTCEWVRHYLHDKQQQ